MKETSKEKIFEYLKERKRDQDIIATRESEKIIKFHEGVRRGIEMAEAAFGNLEITEEDSEAYHNGGLHAIHEIAKKFNLYCEDICEKDINLEEKCEQFAIRIMKKFGRGD